MIPGSWLQLSLVLQPGLCSRVISLLHALEPPILLTVLPDLVLLIRFLKLKRLPLVLQNITHRPSAFSSLPQYIKADSLFSSVSQALL